MDFLQGQAQKTRIDFTLNHHSKWKYIIDILSGSHMKCVPKASFIFNFPTVKLVFFFLTLML